ncbi:hypothetical protein CDL15_Pgr024500 [Punica granatum]|uniref:Uncharacterized protein n=1 Tax=Punica granatum TaxID=22663 RepID=A0A218XZP3_PUNGR|nr:hypothetical protein CDL15_Pgr024500 [Punica granatum]PKI78323.1 hypothetical protein CRG98_001266 [Punica granatum]
MDERIQFYYLHSHFIKFNIPTINSHNRRCNSIRSRTCSPSLPPVPSYLLLPPLISEDTFIRVENDREKSSEEEDRREIGKRKQAVMVFRASAFEWLAIEMAFNPLLDRACTAMNLYDPNRDPDDDEAPSFELPTPAQPSPVAASQ